MAGVCVLIAFGRFVPTYWSRLAAGSLGGAPILHIHASLFFAWTLFFLTQTTFAALGRSAHHRAWGLAGIALSSAMSCSVVLAAINSMRVAESAGMAEQARRFSYVSLSGVVPFSGLLVDLLIVAGMLHDWRTRGRPHAAYLVGGALLLANQVLAVPLSATAAWISIARAVQSLAG